MLRSSSLDYLGTDKLGLATPLDPHNGSNHCVRFQGQANKGVTEGVGNIHERPVQRQNQRKARRAKDRLPEKERDIHEGLKV